MAPPRMAPPMAPPSVSCALACGAGSVAASARNAAAVAVVRIIANLPFVPCLTRRTLIKATAGIAVTALAPRIVLAQTAPLPAGPFRQDPLPYAPNALEPSIDARTMEIHYGKHHAAYVANLNAVAKDNPQIAQMPVEQVLAKLGELPDAIRTNVRNNLGGHANHTMFWQVMGPPGHRPEAEVAAAIERDL